PPATTSSPKTKRPTTSTPGTRGACRATRLSRPPCWRRSPRRTSSSTTNLVRDAPDRRLLPRLALREHRQDLLAHLRALRGGELVLVRVEGPATHRSCPSSSTERWRPTTAPRRISSTVRRSSSGSSPGRTSTSTQNSLRLSVTPWSKKAIPVALCFAIEPSMKRRTTSPARTASAPTPGTLNRIFMGAPPSRAPGPRRWPSRARPGCARCARGRSRPRSSRRTPRGSCASPRRTPRRHPSASGRPRVELDLQLGALELELRVALLRLQEQEAELADLAPGAARRPVGHLHEGVHLLVLRALVGGRLAHGLVDAAQARELLPQYHPDAGVAPVDPLQHGGCVGLLHRPGTHAAD